MGVVARNRMSKVEGSDQPGRRLIDQRFDRRHCLREVGQVMDTLPAGDEQNRCSSFWTRASWDHTATEKERDGKKKTVTPPDQPPQYRFFASPALSRPSPLLPCTPPARRTPLPTTESSRRLPPSRSRANVASCRATPPVGG